MTFTVRFCGSDLFLVLSFHQLQHHSIVQQEQPRRNDRACRRHYDRRFSSHRVLACLS